MFSLVKFIPRAIVQGIPLLYGSTGETITEKAGNLNLGIAGIMYVGGICGVIGAFLYETNAAEYVAFWGIAIPLLCCLLGSLIMGLIYFGIARKKKIALDMTLTVAGMIVGTIVAYALGTVWFVFQMDCDWGYAMSVCVIPFIPFDLGKIVLANILGRPVRKVLLKQGFIQ